MYVVLFLSLFFLHTYQEHADNFSELKYDVFSSQINELQEIESFDSLLALLHCYFSFSFNTVIYALVPLVFSKAVTVVADRVIRDPPLLVM